MTAAFYVSSLIIYKDLMLFRLIAAPLLL